jgi:hypothetical protein
VPRCPKVSTREKLEKSVWRATVFLRMIRFPDAVGRPPRGRVGGCSMLSRKAGGDHPRRTSDLPLAVQPLSQRRNPLATSFLTRVSTIRQETGATSSIHPHALETQHLIASVASHWRRGWVHDLQPTELQPEAPTAGLSEQGSYIRNTYWYEVPTVGGSGRPSPEHPVFCASD